MLFPEQVLGVSVKDLILFDLLYGPQARQSITRDRALSALFQLKSSSSSICCRVFSYTY